MSVLTQGNYLGDWLIDEFSPPNYCREEVTVLVDADLASGRVLGLEGTFTTSYYPYDNSNAAAASAINVNQLEVADAKTVTSIVDASNTSTITFPSPHGLIVGDVIKISGATVDTDLNSNRAVASVPTSTTLTCASASVSDATYTETTLRVTKLNQTATVLKRGPAVVSKAGLDWGSSDSTGITAGLAELATLEIIAREGV